MGFEVHSPEKKRCIHTETKCILHYIAEAQKLDTRPMSL